MSWLLWISVAVGYIGLGVGVIGEMAVNTLVPMDFRRSMNEQPLLWMALWLPVVLTFVIGFFAQKATAYVLASFFSPSSKPEQARDSAPAGDAHATQGAEDAEPRPGDHGGSYSHAFHPTPSWAGSDNHLRFEEREWQDMGLRIRSRDGH